MGYIDRFMSETAIHPEPKKSGWRRWAQALGAPGWTVAGLLWFGALTVWGTLYQVEHGLHEAVRRFFHSWIFLAGGVVPLPGMQGAAALMMVNLLASMAMRFRRLPRPLGLWIVHLGLVVLFAGGVLSQRLAKETTLALAEGERASVSLSETEWELAALTPRPEGGREVRAYDLASLRTGPSILVPGASGPVEVLRVIPSADIAPEAGESPTPEQIRARADPVDPRRVRPAVVLRVGGERFALLGEGLAAGLPLDGGGSAHLHLRRVRRPLPLAMKLLKFEKQVHPNSSIPRSYSSRVEVEADGQRREAVISMNRPFRHGAFTFYQSSYMENPGQPPITVLAVSENHVRLFPYAATALMTAGMFIHYLPRPRRRGGR